MLPLPSDNLSGPLSSLIKTQLRNNNLSGLIIDTWFFHIEIQSHKTL
jgi:hypothetical protein